jgi:cell division septal protein FtsQ
VAPGRLSRPGWKLLAVAALAVLVWLGAPRLFGGMEFFQVRRVEVRGLRNLRAEEVLRALPVESTRSVFGDFEAWQAVADSIPGVESAEVSVRLPGTVVVTVRETEPVALVMRRGRLQLVGVDGEVLAFDPTVAAPDLPVLEEADSVVTRLLARVREADATFFARVVSGSRVVDDVILAAGRQRYWFRPGAGAEAIRAVLAVEQDLENKGKSWTELDARFAGQVVVRGGGA